MIRNHAALMGGQRRAWRELPIYLGLMANEATIKELAKGRA